MSLSPEEQYVQLVARKNITEQEYLDVFDKLKPVAPEKFMGSWKGANVNSNHPTEKKLTDMNWAGKDFRSTEDVDPIMVTNDAGERIWNESWGHARLRQIEWRGSLSTAMVYDDFPIIDYFRYVNDDLLAGAMDAKSVKEGTYFFYLHK
ncbi:uncharacterized protein N7484_007981 [Penicillium longicatenatum]|uniref:uncharacterized protein n=1 Tax=Penicillium longicatenatum TaxID=1561947 RepID=UPI00254743A3|nr:uncharacterized protein N7484_007981 [Penicillium longicatenatum]KAJ5640119.1 hypothetical protein N7484_007981 [Penicillium longicatenatum]